MTHVTVGYNHFITLIVLVREALLYLILYIICLRLLLCNEYSLSINAVSKLIVHMSCIYILALLAVLSVLFSNHYIG